MSRKMLPALLALAGIGFMTIDAAISTADAQNNRRRVERRIQQVPPTVRAARPNVNVRAAPIDRSIDRRVRTSPRLGDLHRRLVGRTLVGDGSSMTYNHDGSVTSRGHLGVLGGTWRICGPEQQHVCVRLENGFRRRDWISVDADGRGGTSHTNMYGYRRFTLQ